jgi:uncharacterized lipoprotein YajG
MKPSRLALHRKEVKREIKTLSLIFIKIGFALLADCEATVHRQLHATLNSATAPSAAYRMNVYSQLC